MCWLVGSNGFTLTVGLSADIGCVQHAPSDGGLPYLMATDPNESHASADDVSFSVGGTDTPIARRYCIPFQRVQQIVAHFMETGNRSPTVDWEEI
jgi:hypothetical protein